MFSIYLEALSDLVTGPTMVITLLTPVINTLTCAMVLEELVS